jgi:hypothetical protein
VLGSDALADRAASEAVAMVTCEADDIIYLDNSDKDFLRWKIKCLENSRFILEKWILKPGGRLVITTPHNENIRVFCLFACSWTSQGLLRKWYPELRA